MAPQETRYLRVDSPLELHELLESLTEPGGASLRLEGEGEASLPVLVLDARLGETLLLDISAIREILGPLRRGQRFRLEGQVHGKLLRSPWLSLEESHEVDGRLQCSSACPEWLEVLQRRASYRAELRLSMEVGVILRALHGELGGASSLQGDLRDLSVQGCRVELPAMASGALPQAPERLELELCFPSGQRFSVQAEVRHLKPEPERYLVQAGFHFVDITPEQERLLWFYVREIEREAARHASDGDTTRAPSALFQSSEAAPQVGRRRAESYPTAMARRLARLAAYLDAQLLDLQQGHGLDSIELSRNADRLLMLLDEDREELLFALSCLTHEAQLVQHGLAVAVRLVDLVATQQLPQGLRKSLGAAAMIHDLGKGMLPAELQHAQSLNAAQYRQLKAHVALILDQAAPCHWLSRSVVTAVVGGINERLDGSGYPDGKRGPDLPELARLAAVVDVVDAMGRPRTDRPAWSVASIYRHLLCHPERFEQRWVKRYIAHFGRFPVGTLVRYAGGELAWVRRLDRQGKPSQVSRVEQAARPQAGLAAPLYDGALAALGEPVEALPLPPA